MYLDSEGDQMIFPAITFTAFDGVVRGNRLASRTQQNKEAEDPF
jgi:hypothetical protein